MADLTSPTTSTNNDTDLTKTSGPTKNSPIIRRDNEEYEIVKKLPRRFPVSYNHIYVTSKTDFNAQLSKCNKILAKESLAADQNSNENVEVYLHAMGSAINKAINLALRLHQSNECRLDTYTSTIMLEDDLIPLMDHLDISFQQRHISAVHIKITL